MRKYCVKLDGVIIGYIRAANAEKAINKIRLYTCMEWTAEIVKPEKKVQP